MKIVCVCERERERESERKGEREASDGRRRAEGQGRSGGGKKRSTSQIWLAVSSYSPLRRITCPFCLLSLSLVYELHRCGKRELWSTAKSGKGRIPLVRQGGV